MTRHLIAALAAVLLVATPAVLAEAGGGGAGSPGLASGAAHRSIAPDYHDVERDGPVYMTRDNDGGLWAVWSYHAGANVDVAVSRVVGTTWTTPQIVGSGNNVTDLDPRLTFFRDGTAMLVWWQERGGPAPNRVMSATLSSTGWSAPRTVSPTLVSARNPTFIEVETDDPLIGYVVDGPEGSTEVVTVPARPTQNTRGGTNGPDPIPTIGDGQNGNESSWTRKPRSHENGDGG